ncbi:MAG: hypothetical protein QM756_36595 [Polyangiaceae bacterium]
MALEAEITKLVALWKEGLLTNGELSSCFLDLVDSTNVDDVVRAVPDDWRAYFTDHLREISREGPLFSIRACVYRYELEGDPIVRAAMKAEVERRQAAEREHFENVVRPAIREWVRTHP